MSYFVNYLGDDESSNQTIYDKTIEAGEGYLNAVFPVGNVKIQKGTSHYDPGIIKAGPSSTTMLNGAFHDAFSLWRLGRKDRSNKVDRIIAVVPPKWFGKYFNYQTLGVPLEPGLGFGILFGMVNSVVFIENNYALAIPHKMQHSYDFDKERYNLFSCSGDECAPFFADTTKYISKQCNDYSLDIRNLYKLPPTGQCFLCRGTSTSGYWIQKNKEVAKSIDYMGSGSDILATNTAFYPDHIFTNPANSRWTTKENFLNLFKEFRVSKDDPEVLLVMGIMGQDKTATITGMFREPLGEVDESTEGDGAIRVLDKIGTTIIEFPFKIDFSVTHIPKKLDYAPFAFAIPYPSDAAIVQVVQDGKVLMQANTSSTLLRDAIVAIPDNGFDKNPSQRRNALLNKVEALDKLLTNKEYIEVLDKLRNDIRKNLDSWLADNYPTQLPLEYTKTDILGLVDELLQRLGN